MESENSKTDSKNGALNKIIKNINMQWPNHLTVLDLSNRKITDFDEAVAFPPNLTELDLSHNNLRNIPSAVLNLEKVKCINLSYNKIQYFDDIPLFCHSIEDLDLSHNELLGPPYWVWTESPDNLSKMDLSSNMNLSHSLTDTYVAELYQYKPLVAEVKIFNCRIRNYLEFLSTFSKAKTLEIGSPDMSMYWSNRLGYIPCEGLDQCCDIEKLNLSNTQIYSVEPTINIYKNLIEINLSHNNINNIPNQFCHLENLEVCTLSFNNILYLPEDMVKLKKLTCLRLDSNGLCMLPENICSLPKLKILDLYDNSLYQVAEAVRNMEELDLAQNYLEEPDDNSYMEKKRKLRMNIDNRKDGSKPEVNLPESEHSSDTTDDEEFMNYINNCTIASQNTNEERTSSPEDWDSDDYWVPRYYQNNKPSQAVWLHFVKRKMQEGNFCPMDLHTLSVAEKVRYERMCNPKPFIVTEGQFDDLSSDES